ncbi:hypothetical protein LCGC14_2702700 [marine sediment metagenome]|uniref:Uncharacterized protein n=1 Tax=marine sediment metagenome TaxID=412755 RepID=A0A0F9A2W5_9ZZZZ
MIKIDDRVIIRDEHDNIKACCGHESAIYEGIKVRQYTVVTNRKHGGDVVSFTFRVDEAGIITFVSEPKQLVEGVDIV